MTKISFDLIFCIFAHLGNQVVVLFFSVILFNDWIQIYIKPVLIYKVWFHWRIPIGKFLYSLFCDGINILVKNNKCTQNQRTGDDLNMWSHPRQWEIAGFCPAAAAAAKSLQSSPTLCDPIDSGPPGFPVPGILQARTLEWAAISFSNAWKWKVKVKSLSRVRLLATPWTAAYQAPPSMEFSRQEYWSGVPLP